MPQKGIRSVSMREEVVIKVEAYFEEHKEELLFQNITSTSALIQFLVVEGLRKRGALPEPEGYV